MLKKTAKAKKVFFILLISGTLNSWSHVANFGLYCCVVLEAALDQDHQCFKKCYVRLYNISKVLLMVYIVVCRDTHVIAQSVSDRM